MYCAEHTAYSPHGDRGNCGLLPSCVCQSCFLTFSEADRKKMARANKMPAKRPAPAAAGVEGGNDAGRRATRAPVEALPQVQALQLALSGSGSGRGSGSGTDGNSTARGGLQRSVTHPPPGPADMQDDAAAHPPAAEPSLTRVVSAPSASTENGSTPSLLNAEGSRAHEGKNASPSWKVLRRSFHAAMAFKTKGSRHNEDDERPPQTS